eukprot:CAMPEP_0176434038 /NCGR_PEP_ID=MMETSP0127-20121128/16422_1 /TAXON_ID=938130 /ORGANISM="Platyophrya macrostoma, Strain WH" /LENGTH=109 /DNA_ID=CAMNT_0017816665 /DNA_START=49 /DNA_END=378 /DNA_ORIENTATION=+
MSVDTLACTYAALICHDAGLATSSDNIQKAITAAGLEVRETLPILFARFLEKKSLSSLFAAATAAAPTGAPAAAAAAAPAAGGAAPAAAAAKKPVEEEAEDDMGFDLFG